MYTLSGSITPTPPLWINSKEARKYLWGLCGNPTASRQWRVDRLEAFLRRLWYLIRIDVPLEHQAMSAIRFLIIMQWRRMKNTHWTNQISQETYKYCSVNYNIIFINEYGVTIVLHKDEFKSLGMNLNLPTGSNCMSLHG